MESGGGTPSIDPSAEHSNCVVGTEPTEEFACMGKRQSVQRDLEREEEVLSSFDNMSMDVGGEVIFYTQFVQGNLHTFDFGK